MDIVGDFMTKDLITIEVDTPLDKVLDMLLSNDFRRLPVVTHDNRPVGIISDRDIRLVIDSPFLKTAPIDKLKNLKDHKASEIMRTVLYTVSSNAIIVNAAKKILTTGVGSLIVKDEEGKLAGIITRTDLIRYLTKVLDTE